jgi:hypothetical protein
MNRRVKGGFVRDLRERARAGWPGCPCSWKNSATYRGIDRRRAVWRGPGLCVSFRPAPASIYPESRLVGDALIVRAAAGGQVTSIVRDNARARGEVKTCRTD